MPKRPVTGPAPCSTSIHTGLASPVSGGDRRPADNHDAKTEQSASGLGVDGLDLKASAIHKDTGQWIGKIDLSVLEDWPGDDKTEVGWELDPAFWGQGLATEGGKAAIGYGFTELKLSRIISVTTPTNVASWRVMEKCGLVYRRIHWGDVDSVWYAIDRTRWLGHGRPM